MAVHASKRRKLEHDSSEDDDQASFASFSEDGEDGEDREEMEMNGQDAGGDSELEEASDEDEDHVDEARPAARPERKGPKKQNDTAKSALQSSGGIYTAGTFKSNMFKLQVDELLEQIKPRRGKREESAEQALHALKATIERTPQRPMRGIDEAERELLMSSKVAVPFPDPRPAKDAKYKLECAKPAHINVIGSFAMKTSSRTKDTLEVDMTVTVPPSLFQDKDYLNHRYFYKRSYYLACIAAQVKQAHGADYDICFEDFRDDQLKPVLVVSPKEGSGKSGEVKPAPKWRINVLPCIGTDMFPAEKLLPTRNCVRQAEDAKSDPTPFYNSSLRADMLTTQYLKLVHGAGNSCPAFRDACLLGSTWLRQRGFTSNKSAGGFGNFEWHTLMALLLQGGGPNGKPVLSEGYSSYQLFKATLQVLAMKDMSKQAVVIGHASGDLRAAASGLPMVWDGLRSHNVLYKMQPWAYLQLRREARTTLAMLGDQLYEGFDATFIIRLDNPLLRYDCAVELPAGAVKDASKLYEVLKRGLGDRVSQVTIRPPGNGSWQLGAARPKSSAQGSLQAAFNVNPDTVHRTVDHGPSAENKAEASSFCKFWGEKAELRRFKDGSIQESLVWAPSEAGQPVLEQIVRFLLKRHVGGMADASAKFTDDGFSRMLRHGSSTVLFKPLMEAFKQLEVDIRGLEDLPLSIRQIMPADAQLRYSSIQPPVNVPGRPRPLPADVTIQFEGSARWPDDLVAIQRTKIAFLLNICEKMQEAVDGVTTRIGLENQDHDSLNQGFLEIIYDSGAAFRMRVHHDREQTLLERQLKDKSLAPSVKESAAVGLAAYKRLYLRTPAHTQSVARLCSRYPALSGTIRLTKKWFASHLLANHVAEEVIELIAIRNFVQPWPWQVPSSVQTGFLRTLHWLSRWDWRAEPLVVDLSGSAELKQPEVQAIKTHFDAWRKLDPSMNRIVLFAASNADTDGTTYTDSSPSKVIAARMTALAKAASAEIEEKTVDLEAANLFASPLSDYDFVVHLSASASGGKKRRSLNGNAAFKNLELASLDDPSMVGFEPVTSFLNELEKLYGSAVLFFSGGIERPVIAGLWSPQTAPRTWKVNLAYSTIPAKEPKAEDVQAHINKDAILAEVARLGGDMIEKIEAHR
ncbi:Nrap protein [Hortaea werneckii]|nr:Nrap protein [Hortaea werneckii]